MSIDTLTTIWSLRSTVHSILQTFGFFEMIMRNPEGVVDNSQNVKQFTKFHIGFHYLIVILAWN